MAQMGMTAIAGLVNLRLNFRSRQIYGFPVEWDASLDLLTQSIVSSNKSRYQW
jgi:hypothetical protein